MPDLPSSPDYDPAQMAEKIRSGEYFREAKQAYDIAYHAPMAERYAFMGMTAVSLLIFMMALIAMLLLYPLKTEVPFIYHTADIVDDYPRMQPIGAPGEDANQVIKQFLVSNYVRLREGYHIDLIERNANGVLSQSNDAVFEAYESLMNPSNPSSPVVLFERRAVRKVAITGYRQLTDNQMTVYYDEMIRSSRGTQKSAKQATVTFEFTPIEIDQETAQTSDLVFMVTDYRR